MATIGTFTRTPNGFTGSVKTLTLNVKSVKVVEAEGSDNEKSPDFRVLTGATEFGAAWKEKSAKGNDYLGQAGRSELPAPIFASLIETEGEEWALIWSRRRPAN